MNLQPTFNFQLSTLDLQPDLDLPSDFTLDLQFALDLRPTFNSQPSTLDLQPALDLPSDFTLDLQLALDLQSTFNFPSPIPANSRDRLWETASWDLQPKPTQLLAETALEDPPATLDCQPWAGRAEAPPYIYLGWSIYRRIWTNIIV